MGAQTSESVALFKQDQVILIEDTQTYRHLICSHMSKEFGFEPMVCQNYGELEALLEKSSEQISFAISDLHTPGAEAGAALKLLQSYDIPAILLSGHRNQDIRNDLEINQIGDYIVKDSPHSINLLMDTIHHFSQISAEKILVVDGTLGICEDIKPALSAQLLSVTTANNRLDALSILEKQSDFNLIICEFGSNDAYEECESFVQTIKLLGKLNKLRVLAVLTDDNRLATAMHLKSGVDDFIRFPARPEELQWRVGQNIVQTKSVNVLQELASTDYLTGLYNRRHFFKEGNVRIKAASIKSKRQSVAMIDIDHFKKLNDTYGHDIGDAVLKEVARRFEKCCGDEHLLARMGGEEFTVLINEDDIHLAEKFCNKVRESICSEKIKTEEGDLDVTISIGVASASGDEDFINYITAADQYLYMAKHAGRNKVLAEPAMD